MAYKYKILLTLAPLILFLDQLTKFFILQTVPIGDVISVLPGYFDIVHIRNTGAAFGMLANLDEVARVPFFYGVSGIAICILIYAFLHLDPKDHYYPWPLSLIASGILGNLIDRFRFGNVVDFISLHIQESTLGSIKLEWPAFNVADSAITVSMILLFAHILQKK